MSGEEAPAPAETLAQPLEAMDLMTTLQLVLKKSLAHGGLARGLHEDAKVIEKHAAQLCVLAGDCNQPDYIKLAKALCADHGVGLLTVPSAKTLGKWAGLCNIDSRGKRENRGCFFTMHCTSHSVGVERGGAEDEDEKSDDEDLAEEDEEESDLDFAWKMLDVAIAATRIFRYLRSSGF
ncbi:hypothetical protein DKX38_029123 [Salix brachista]|uniref:40S ribosomal protein S12 n=1 Tax=Salix brachista TaxID=2182728 RepID=A0A5N5J388_9ROSI|nr:hypothetical protein DKX38_029123 [Salix brachista]